MTGGTQRRLAAIVMADVVGYSRLMGTDETGTLVTLRGHRTELIDPLVAKHRGRLVKSMGDGLLLEFASVINAAGWAIAVQEGMADRNTGLPPQETIRFRIGIHLGDIIVEGDDIFGDGVNVAARIQALADADGIAVSDDAYRQVRDRVGVAWLNGGEHAAKNIARPVSIWHWARRGEQSPTTAASSGERTGVSDRASVAVLPFDNMSGDPEQAYFADGITEDIITEISKVPGLAVISRNSTFTYKGKPARPQDVCADLGVRYVVEGSVRKAGPRVRITAQLIEGASGGHLWAERYDRELADIFAVQDDVTEKIVHAIASNLVRKTRDRASPSDRPVPMAYDYVLRGREQYRLFSRTGNSEARRLFARAVELDPSYAAGYAGLAMVALHEWFHGKPAALGEAFDLAQKANALDASLPLVHEAIGNIQLFRKRYDDAIAAIERWIDVEPGNADAYANLAGLLHFVGEPEGVGPLIDKAIRLNPFYPFYYTLYRGQAYLMMAHYDEALDALRRSVAHNPEALPAHLYLAACCSALGDDVAARRSLDEVFRIHPGFSVTWLRTYFPYKRTEDIERLLVGLRMAGLSE